MHIAFLTSEYPHSKINNSAGIGASIKNLATELVKQGQQASIFVYSQDNNEIFDDNGIIIHKIKHIKYLFLGWYLYRKHIQSYINNRILKEGIEILEAPDWTGITAFMNLKCPVVVRLHGSDAYFCNLEGRKQKFKNYLFEKIALESTDVIISVSDFAAIKTKDIFNIKCNIKIIPNGIDLKKFKNKNPKLFEVNTILYFGTLIRKKGVLDLANIFNKLVELDNNVKLILIGNDSEDFITKSKSTYNLMQNIFSDKAKLKVKYIGKLPYNSLIEHIKTAQICIFPSLAETFGMVTIEAMALQKTVVTSNFGWNKGIIDDGFDGILINPKDYNEVADCINNLLKNKSEVLKIGKLARNKVEDCFNIVNVAKQNINFYQSILNK
jgi:glycosyltransferase involved in cell wall biosynthesis